MSNAVNVITLQVLLHIYCRPTNYPEKSPAVNEAHMRLTATGMIEYRGMGDYNYEVTEKGRIFVEHLLTVPFPVANTQWVIPKEEA